MSHQHSPGTRGICLQCGCGDGGASSGCNDDEWSGSCLNKEMQMRDPNMPNPPGSTHDSESQFTMAQREVAGWESANELLEPDTSRYESFLHDSCVEGHDPEVYCSGCAPLTFPKDEVGTFDIGQKQDAGGIDYPRGFLPTETFDDEEEKGPGFEARLKNMEGKAPMSLLSPIFIEGICAVLAYGSEKYAPNMWRDNPMTFTAELDSIFRHLFAFLRCEDYDAAPPSGSGLLHLFNAGCRLMFLTERYFTHPELDDRYPAPGLKDAMFDEETEAWLDGDQEEVEEGAEAQYEDPIPGYQYYSRADLIKELDRVWNDLKEERHV